MSRNGYLGCAGILVLFGKRLGNNYKHGPWEKGSAPAVPAQDLHIY